MISGHVTCLVTCKLSFPSQRMHPERQGEAMWGLVRFCEESS